MNLLRGLAFAVCLLSSLTSVLSISCKDEKGNNVDWFYFYKLPINSSKSDPNIATGYAYSYVLSTGSSSSFTLSSLSMSDENSLVGRTLAPMYTSSRSDLIYVLYNDEHPDDSTTSSYGHSKGVLLADENEGIWLIHSTPKYPPESSSKYSYPDSGTTYGQTFLCITFDTAVTDTIGLQFKYNCPWIYDSNIPSWANSVAPNLYDYVINDEKVTSEPWTHVASFNSAGGQAFKSFAKHKNFGLDLYYDLVAPNIKSDLNVETWNHGSDDLPSQCSGYAVMNVAEVYNSAVGYSFTTGSDHSKWGAAPTGSSDPWVCVGDINRAESQEGRSGGTVCSLNQRPWKAFSDSVKGTVPC
ncbi:hypothetical protein CHUAL_011666 [Chamberlinius hualienensis]